jgi:hypothetical protein
MYFVYSYFFANEVFHLSAKLPNFLIVGAAKCGTTSLYYYLADHPDVFFPKQYKEPNFFSSKEIVKTKKRLGRFRPIINEWGEYKELFSGVTNEKAIGEASTETLYYYESSIPLIKQYLGDPKIIILLRNPVDQVFSRYTQMIRDGTEILSFEDAILAEDERIKSGWQYHYHYLRHAFYTNQVKAFIENFSSVKVYIFEEFMEDIRTSVQDVCDFLQINSDYISPNEGIRFNPSGVPRRKWLNDLFLMYNPIQQTVRKTGIFLLSESKYIALREKIRGRNLVKTKINQDTRLRLMTVFNEDILALQEVLNRDLSIWLDKKRI